MGPSSKDLVMNFTWLRPWAMRMPQSAPSAFYIADVLLETDRLLSSNLLLPKDASTVDEIAAAKQTLALTEAGRLKKMLQYLRYLFRASPTSSNPKLNELKSFLRRRPVNPSTSPSEALAPASAVWACSPSPASASSAASEPTPASALAPPSAFAASAPRLPDAVEQEGLRYRAFLVASATASLPPAVAKLLLSEPKRVFAAWRACDGDWQLVGGTLAAEDTRGMYGGGDRQARQRQRESGSEVELRPGGSES